MLLAQADAAVFIFYIKVFVTTLFHTTGDLDYCWY